VSEGGDRIDAVARVPGRPPGLEFLTPDELLVWASEGGLLAVTLDGRPVRILTDSVGGRRLLGIKNAVVAPDRTVYFTDSSTEHRLPEWRADLIERPPSTGSSACRTGRAPWSAGCPSSCSLPPPRRPPSWPWTTRAPSRSPAAAGSRGSHAHRRPGSGRDTVVRQPARNRAGDDAAPRF
jgi:hypothetical protein